MALDAGGPSITTLEELLPLLEGVTKVKAFGWIIIQHVPAKPRSLKGQLARAARDHFGHDWTAKTLLDWLSPGRHTEKRTETLRVASATWHKENPRDRAEYNAAWHKENPRDRAEYKAAWHKANPRDRAEYKAAWHKANPRDRSDYLLKQHHKRQAIDPQYRLARALRSRLYTAVKAGGAGKSASTLELTGCTLPELMAHLESQFTEGMTWANQGEWEIDHIRPCASFDLTDPEQQRQCFYFSNLQPLWAADNLAKSDSLDWSPNAGTEPDLGLEP